jgi:Cellulase (glycosyl hydrolase family 5)/Family of unknown function (DUF6298)
MHQLLLLASLVLLGLVTMGCTRAEPLRLHPDNPHYFLFRGKPTILITSAEHYGAVLNADFDTRKYLDTLAKDGLNHTRTWVGVYCENVGDLNIAGNTLAPAPGKFICPWARSGQPGYANGGNKFDLTRWDDAYFARLKQFVKDASDRGIVVEVNLFCPFYQDGMWSLSPMNARNNVNNVGNVKREQVYTLDQHGGLLPYQEALTRKIVAELREFDNVFYEVMNEPYVGNVPMNWQERIIDVIVEAKKQTGSRQLISLNIANEKGKVEKLNPAVSILNFHYCWPPDTVEMNYHHPVVIGENETGGIGGGDYRYRREGWAFILAGGALYNNLDYSFTVGHEDGTFVYPANQPGGGTAALRKQLRTLKDFIHEFDFLRMKPDQAVFVSALPEGVRGFVLSEPGHQYAAYLCRVGDALPAVASVANLSLDLPRGTYQMQWINPLDGRTDPPQRLEHAGGQLKLSSPAFREDVALRVKAAK